MNVIIAGSRTITDIEQVKRAVEASKMVVDEVVSGGARGVDLLGEQWAAEAGVLVKRFPAQWDKFGKVAGYLRNQQMADYADALIACWDGQSRGTADMVRRAEKRGLAVYVHTTEQQVPSGFMR